MYSLPPIPPRSRYPSWPLLLSKDQLNRNGTPIIPSPGQGLADIWKVHVKLLITRDIFITVIASYAAYRLDNLAISLGGVAYLTTTLLICGYHVDEQGIIRGQ
jgi:hypothetical protein